MTTKAPICGIYAIWRIGTAECYVGHSIDLAKREREHWNDLKSDRHRSSRLQNSFNKYGLDAFVFQILEDGLSPTGDHLEAAERRWMDILMPCFNSHKVMGSKIGFAHSAETRAKIGAASRGRRHSEQTRQLMSAQRIGNKYRVGHQPSITGKHLSEETKSKISASKKGIPNLKKRGFRHSEETKRKISLSKLGVKQSAETIRLKSERRKGVPWSDNRRAAFERSKLTKEIYFE